MTHRFKKCITLLVIGTMLTAMTQSVAFTRDTSNRITAITDPSGKKINYAYNASGDLTTVTNCYVHPSPMPTSIK